MTEHAEKAVELVDRAETITKGFYADVAAEHLERQALVFALLDVAEALRAGGES